MKLAAGPIVAWAALHCVLCAHSARADTLALRPSREIGILVPRPAAPAERVTPATVAARPQTASDNEPRGALFLRADRLEGTEREITAEGNVELRTRRETVLADRLTYEIDTQ